MAHRPKVALCKRRSSASRPLMVLALVACITAIGLATTGCAWWQESPQQPRTVTDWMKLPRVEP
jgi:hypothetical protein